MKTRFSEVSHTRHQTNNANLSAILAVSQALSSAPINEGGGGYKFHFYTLCCSLNFSFSFKNQHFNFLTLKFTLLYVKFKDIVQIFIILTQLFISNLTYVIFLTSNFYSVAIHTLQHKDKQ